MEKLFKRVCIALFIVSFSTSLFAGGPWTQKKGLGYYKISEWWLVYDKHYTSTGQLDPNTTAGVFNTFFYAEHGVSDRFTALVSANIFARNLNNNVVSKTTGELLIPGEAINGIGDIDVAGKWAINKPGASTPMAVTVLLGIPTGQVGKGQFENLQTGDGEFNQMLQFDIGRGFQLIPGLQTHASGFLALNNRTRGFSDEFRYGGEFGLGLGKGKLWAIGRLIGVESFKNSDPNANTNFTGIFANNTEYTSYGIELAYYVGKKWGFSVGANSAFRGEIIAAAPSYTFGFFWDASK